MKSVTDRGSSLRSGGSAARPAAIAGAAVAVAVLIPLFGLLGEDVGSWIPAPGEDALGSPQGPLSSASETLARPAITAGLELTGVVTGGRQGIAIIVDSGGAQKLYRVGESVRPGLTFKEALPDAVMLRSGEVTERLTLAGVRDDRVLATPASSMTAAVGATDRQESSGGVLTLFMPEPDGGFRVQKSKPGSVYESMGLRPGDVVHRLNGVSLYSAKQLTALDRHLNAGERGEVEVLRDGRFQVLRYGTPGAPGQ